MCETNQIWSFVRYFIIGVTKSLACIYLKISCKSKCSIFCNYKDEINKGKLHMITIGWTFFCSCDQSFPNSKLIMPQFCLYPLDNDFFFLSKERVLLIFPFPLFLWWGLSCPSQRWPLSMRQAQEFWSKSKRSSVKYFKERFFSLYYYFLFSIRIVLTKL